MVKKSIKCSLVFLLLLSLCFLGLLTCINIEFLNLKIKAESPAFAYDTSGKACTTWADVRTELTSGRSCYLANDVTISDGDIITIRQGTRTDVNFNNVTFYGNGKTISISPTGYANILGKDQDNVNDHGIHGILANTINNSTVKDLNITLKTHFSTGSYVNSGTNYLQYLGIVAGSMENSTFTNVNVKVESSASFVFYGKRNGGGGGQGASLGAFAGNVKSGTFNKCSVTLDGGIWSTAEDGSENNNAGTQFTNINPRAVVGGFFGEYTGSGALNMNNVALNGETSGILGTSLWGGNGGKDGNFRMGIAGGIIGGASGSQPINIDGLIYDYSGSMAALRDLTTRTGLIIGNRYEPTKLTIKNVYRNKNRANGNFIKLNNNNAQVYRNASSTASNGQSYPMTFTSLVYAPYSSIEYTDNSYANRILGRNSSSTNASFNNYNYYSNNGHLGSANSGTYGSVNVSLSDDTSKINITHTISDTNRYIISGIDYGGGKASLLMSGKTAKGTSTFTEGVLKNDITKIECHVAEFEESTVQSDSVKSYNALAETFNYTLSQNLLNNYKLGVKDASGNITYGALGAKTVNIPKDVGVYGIQVYDLNNNAVNEGVIIGADKADVPSRVVYLKGSKISNYTVNSAKIDITASSFTKFYGDSEPSLTQTIFGYNGETINVRYERDLGENANSYNLNRIIYNNTNYILSFAPGGNNNKFTVLARQIRVTPDKFEKFYGDNDPVLEQTVNGVNGETLLITFIRNNGINVGLYDFQSISNSNGNYILNFDGDTNKYKFEIKPKAIDISATKNYEKIYGASDPRYAETFATGCYSDTLDITFVRELGENAGFYKFDSIVSVSNQNYNVNFIKNDCGLTINPYSLTVTPTLKETVFGDADLTLTESVSGVWGDIIQLVYQRTDFKNRNGYTNAGYYDFIDIAIDANSLDYSKHANNYNILLSESGRIGKYKVNSLSIGVGNIYSFDKIFGESDPTFRQLTDGLKESFYVKFTRAVGENVGFYDFVGVASEDNNYIPFIENNVGKDKFYIGKYKISVTANAFSAIYGEPFPIFEQTVDGLMETIKITYSVDTVARNVGNYSFISFVNPNGNYDISVLALEDKFSITQRTLTITPKEFRKVYGEADPIFTENIIGGYGDVISVLYKRNSGENVKVYDFTDILYDDTNHIVKFTQNGGKDKFIISPYSLKIIPSEFSKIYGVADPLLSDSYEISHNNGIINNVKVIYTRTNASIHDAGKYDLIVQSFDNSNYVITFESGTNLAKFTVHKYVVSYNPAVFSAQYSSENSKKTSYFETIDGLVNYKITVNLERNSGEAVGAYNIISVTINERNYSIDYNADDLLGKFLITPYSIRITANIFSKTFGDTDPIFEEYFSANGETVKATYTRQIGENAGKYSFTEALSDNGNYVFAFNDLGNRDKFTINPKLVSVIWTNEDFTYNEHNQALKVWAKYIDTAGEEIILKTSTIGEFKDFNENGYIFEATFNNQEINYILQQETTFKKFFISKLNVILGTPIYSGSQLQYLDDLPNVAHPQFIKYGEYKLDVNQTLTVANNTYFWTFTPTVSALKNHTFENLNGTMALYIIKATPIYTAPVGLSATYNDTLADVILTEGFSWQESDSIYVGDAGNRIHRVIFTPTDTDNYLTVRDINVFITVNRATYNMNGVTFISATYNFDNLPKNIYINGELPQGVTVDYSGTNFINAGTYNIKAIFSGDYNNYIEISDMSANIVIEKIEYDFSGLSLPKAEKVYNGLPQRLDLLGDLPVGLDGIEVKAEINGFRTDVGVVSTVVTFSSESINYKPINFNLTNGLTIVKREIDITSLETYYTSYILTQDINTVEGEHFKVNNIIKGDIVNYKLNKSFESKKAGETYIIIEVISLDNNNYYFSQPRYKVNAYIDATVEINIESKKYDYDNRIKECEVTATVGKIRTSDFKVEYFDSFDNKIGTPKKAGEYKVKVTMLINGLNDNTAEDVLVINKVLPDYQIIGSNLMQYGGYFPQYLEIKGLYNDGFYSTIEAEYQFEGDFPEVGVYNTVIAFSGSENYLPFESQTVTLEIIKRDIIVEYFGGRVYEYDGKEYGIEYRVHNLINNEKNIVKIGFNNTEIVVNSGEYIAQVKEVNKNYNILKETGFKTVTITKARLSVEILASDYLIEGEKFNYSLKYDGFKGEDGLGDISIYPEVKSLNKKAGVYIVTAEGGESLNYDFNYKKFNLTVFYNNLINTMGNSEIIVEGVYHPDSQIDITAANVDKINFGGFMGIGNKVTSAYSINVKEKTYSGKSYDVSINNINLKSKAFSSAYTIDAKGNISKVNNLITNGTLKLNLEDNVTVVFVENYTVIYALVAALLIVVLILIFVVINNMKFNSHVRTRNSWLRH